LGSGITAAVWFGQSVDSGSIMITDLLNLFCTKGGLTWSVKTRSLSNPGGAYFGDNVLTVYALPATTLANVTRILVSSTPVSRTLGGDYNRIYLRYQSNAATAATPAYATTSVSTPASIAAHQPMEAYDDLSSVGQQTAAAAQAAGQNILNRYQRASFGDAFTIRQGELLNAGGYPVDAGTDQSGEMVRLILADYGYGGEVVPDPVIFMIGGYEWDDTGEQGQVTAFQSLNLSVSNMLSVLSTTLPAKASAAQARSAVL
jgi:hypothetical protein